MKKIKKQGFTLVELIVVITILAILWTIAFVSLQWYSKSARDSARVSDMSRIKTSLELFKIDWAKYPEPTESVSITYNSTEAWTQWTFWQTTFNNVEKLDKIPRDPTTEELYIYSVTNTRKEFLLYWELEADDMAMSPGFPPNPPLLKGGITSQQAEAWRKQKRSRVSGTYNGKVLKVSRWPITSILALPSIVAPTTTVTTVEEIVANKELVADWSTGTWETLVNPDKVVAYEWPSENLQTIDWQKALLEWLQAAYNGTETAKEEEMESILSADPTNNQEIQEIAWWLVATNIAPSSLTNTLSVAPVLDSNCGTTQHWETKEFWSTSAVAYADWQAACDAAKKIFTCNNGKYVDWLDYADTETYNYTSCIVWTASNCEAIEWYTHAWNIYNLWQIEHWSTSTISSENKAENNGTFTYNLTVDCNNGTLENHTVSIPTLINCDTTYHTEDNNTCKSVNTLGKNYKNNIAFQHKLK